MRISGMVRNAVSQKRGTAAIEFGIIAPFLVIFLIGLVELSFAIQQAMQVQDAAEAGALYAGKHGWNLAGITAAVENATGGDGVMATPAPTLFCGCPGSGGVAAIDCNGTCPEGSRPGQYVRISASMAHTPVLTALGLPIPTVLTGHAVVRLQ